MKKIHTPKMFFSIVLLCIASFFQAAQAQVRVPTHRPVTSDTSHHIRRVPPVHYLPITRYRYISQPASRYFQVAGNVYQPKPITLAGNMPPAGLEADYDDSVALSGTISDLMNTIRNNYTEAMEEFVDTAGDLNNVTRLNWTNGYVYKSDIKGLANNLSLLNLVFTKPAFDKEDVDMISYIFDIKDSIIGKINSSHRQPELMRFTTSHPFSLTIVDTAGNPVPEAVCYFVRVHSWSRLANYDKCKCIVNDETCDNVILTELEKTNDGKVFYNAGNPDQDIANLTYGPYHFIIEVNGEVHFHKIAEFQVGTPDHQIFNLGQ